MINKLNLILLNILFFLILLILVNGRSILGIYIFSFRIGELLTGVSFVFILYALFKYKYFLDIFGSPFLITFFSLIIYFFIQNFLKNESFTNLYIYKSSVYIWYIAYIFIGYQIFKNYKFSSNIFIIGYAGLLVQYIFNVLFYPEALISFFSEYSDKVQFLKGSEISIFFIIVTFFSNRYFKKGYMIDLFLLISSLYFPLTIFKSRSAGFAIGCYIIYEIYLKRDYFKVNIKKSIILVLLCASFFAYTSHNLVDNIYEVEETERAIAQVFKHKYVVSNTYYEEVPFLYIFNNRLFSADGNLNWRLQLWQDGLHELLQNDNFITGIGFSSRPEVFNDAIFSGLDGLNENFHNYFLNVLIRGGMFSLLLVIIFFYNLSKNNLINFSKSDFYTFLLPLFFISMFDGSMENPYFAITFYFFVSSFFSGIKFRDKI